MTVRLEWDGKPTQVERISLPFQIVETINESRATRERDEGALFGGGSSRDHSWRNRLIWGDNKLVMSSLLSEFAGGVDLAYIDPPFATGADFTLELKVGSQKLEKERSVLEETAYRDTWGRGLESYLSMMHERLVLIHELLSDSGSLYLHLDAHMAHYLKVVADEIFGRDNFVREIIWRIGWISGYKAKAPNWARNHDTILFYAKNKERFTFNKILVEHDPNYQRSAYGSGDLDTIEVVDEEGEPSTEGKPIDDVWVNLPSIQIMSFSQEKTGYPTQKNLDLLERIISASSNPGDLVADFFCGAGTTAVAAEKLDRRWIACDLGRFAIHTSRKRLLSTPDCKPFEIQNLGSYERQRWRQESGNGALRGYLDTILAFYRAEPVEGFSNLHGRKAGRMVHVGATDAPVTIDEAEEVMDELADNGIESCDLLGWEWEMGLHDTIGERARRRGLDVRTLQIPREVMERTVQEADAVRFFELAYVDLDVRRQTGEAKVVLKDFAIPSEDLIPAQVREQITRWSDLIDYWSVDFDHADGVFRNEWQAYRTKADPVLSTESDWHEYPKPGTYAIVVKIIDIFGNDTTKLAEVTIK
jgi:adenine-specific DNA-methyltransferase